MNKSHAHGHTAVIKGCYPPEPSTLSPPCGFTWKMSRSVLVLMVSSCLVINVAWAGETTFGECLEYFDCIDVECPYGFETNALGCYRRTCKCKPPPVCPLVSCPTLYCPFGRATDANGCPICQCNPPVCPPVSCPTLYCPFGRATDANGCPICQCNPPVCTPVTCPPGQFCPYGYDNDSNGCPTCRCTPRPCQPQVCNNICTGGYALDVNGCQTCGCRCPTVNCQCNYQTTWSMGPNGCLTCICRNGPYEVYLPLP